MQSLSDTRNLHVFTFSRASNPPADRLRMVSVSALIAETLTEEALRRCKWRLQETASAGSGWRRRLHRFSGTTAVCSCGQEKLERAACDGACLQINICCRTSGTSSYVWSLIAFRFLCLLGLASLPPHHHHHHHLLALVPYPSSDIPSFDCCAYCTVLLRCVHFVTDHSTPSPKRPSPSLPAYPHHLHPHPRLAQRRSHRHPAV